MKNLCAECKKKTSKKELEECIGICLAYASEERIDIAGCDDI